jgi:hypothetical protein
MVTPPLSSRVTFKIDLNLLWQATIPKVIYAFTNPVRKTVLDRRNSIPKCIARSWSGEHVMYSGSICSISRTEELTWRNRMPLPLKKRRPNCCETF